MRWFLYLSYKGTHYKGWQSQPGMPTVQGTVERALSLLLGIPVPVTGAGRTDTGVHAARYVAHFDTVGPISDPAHFIYKLNCLLPEDIAVHGVRRVRNEAHARFDASEREYRYYIEPRKNPFTRETTWQYTVPLDLAEMNRAAAMLVGFDDFTTFAKLNSNNRTNRCRIVRADWSTDEQGVHCFTIRADRFLRNMVRAIVGTSVDVGRGKITAARFGEIVAARDLSLSSAGAPAAGLFLSEIVYPELLFEVSENKGMI